MKIHWSSDFLKQNGVRSFFVFVARDGSEVNKEAELQWQQEVKEHTEEEVRQVEWRMVSVFNHRKTSDFTCFSAVWFLRGAQRGDGAEDTDGGGEGCEGGGGEEKQRQQQQEVGEGHGWDEDSEELEEGEEMPDVLSTEDGEEAM